MTPGEDEEIETSPEVNPETNLVEGDDTTKPNPPTPPVKPPSRK